MIRLTDRPDMIIDVYRARKTTIQQQIKRNSFYVKLMKKNSTNAASHQGLHGLLERKSIYVKLMKKNSTDTPKMKNGSFQIIRREESIRLKRCNISGGIK